jgi:sorbitol-specific phosphotransferase system component IIC
LIQLLVIFHWIAVLVTGERIKSLAEFCHMWNVQVYAYLRYLTFVTNVRPFPFGDFIGVKPEDVE